MAQTYKYTIVGDTQPAVKGNEALDASINRVDASTKQLDASTQKLQAEQRKQAEESQKAFSTQLENKIKTTDSLIKGLGGTVNLLTGTLATVVGTLGLFGVDDEQIAGFQKAALSVLALSTGITQQLTGLKDVTEAQKLQNEVTQTSVTLNKIAVESENTNTAALATNKNAVNGVTAAFAQAALSISAETTETSANTIAKSANSAADNVNTGAKTANTIATRLNEIAQRALNLAIKANPYLAIASILISVTSLVIGITSALFRNTKAEEDNTKAKELNERAIKAQEEATKSLDRARGESDVEAAKRAVRELKAEKGAAEARLARAAAENKFSQATEEARLDVVEATTALRNAELDLQEARDEAAEKAKTDAKTAKDKAEALRNERLELEGIRQVILQTSQEAIDSIIFAPAEPGSLLDVRNLQDIDTTLKSVFKSLEEIDLLELEDPIKFLSEEQLTILKRLRGELDTELQQQLFAREQQYKDELALFADNEDAKTRLTEEYEKDRVKIRRQFALQVARDTIGVTSDFLNTIAQINQASLELQLLQAAGNQAAIDRINAEALEKQKKLRIAQTIVTTAESILNGFNATSTLPPPFNFIAGTALAAAYTALGAKTIQTISSTTLDSSAGATGGGFNNIPGGGFGGFSLPGGGGISTTPSQGAILPGLGGGRIAGAPTIGTATQEPIRAYVLAGDVSNGVQANVALNTRRRLAGG